MRIFPEQNARESGPAHKPKLSDSDELLGRLRTRLINDLHLGRLGPGDRLPSIRRVARESGVDHRAVADAYHALEEEGLVEVRGRSGVHVSTPGREGTSLKESARWMVDVMAEAWSREISFPGLRSIVSTCADASELRCACVESNVDQMTAYSEEIGDRSGMQVVSVFVGPSGEAADRATLRQGLRGMDMVVTSLYHGKIVREVAEEEGIPCVVLRINPELVEAVRRRILESGVTIVAASREFGDRMRLMYRDALSRADALRIVLADDPRARQVLAAPEPVLLTRAARELLGADVAAPLVFPHSPTLAAETVQELARTIVRLRLRA